MKAPLRRIVADLPNGRVRLECGHQLGPSAEHHRRRRCHACALEKRRKLSAALASLQERAREERQSSRSAFALCARADHAPEESGAVAAGSERK